MSIIKQLLFVPLVLLVVTGCVLDPVSEPRRPDLVNEPTPVPTLPAVAKPRFSVERGAVTESVRFSGQVAPVEEAEIRFPVSGIVGDVLVAVGDDVVEGEVIATLDQVVLEEALAAAQAELTAAEAEWVAAQNTILSERRLLEIDLERAQILLEYARNTAGDDPTADQTLEIRLLTLDVEEAQLALDLFGSAELPLNERIAQLQADVALIETQLATTEILAPQSGQILAMTVEIGDQVRERQVVGLIGDVGRLEIKADVNSRVLSQLSEEMFVTISSNRLEEPLPAVIRQLPAPYGSGDLDDDEVHITLEDLGGTSLGIRMPVSIEAILDERQDVPWLPPAAIREYSGRRFVLVEDPDGQQRRIDLRLGLVTDEQIEILEGLEGGETVIGP